MGGMRNEEFFKQTKIYLFGQTIEICYCPLRTCAFSQLISRTEKKNFTYFFDYFGNSITFSQCNSNEIHFLQVFKRTTASPRELQ